MPSSPYRIAVSWLESATLLVLTVYLGMHTLPRAWNELNTDFPNYYIAASLARDGYDTARANEWMWLARQKDQRGLDIKVIGLLPITPFSTLAVMPLTGLPALTAKRVWILLNLALLVPLGWFLQSLTGLHYRRIALIFVMNFPLHRNLLYGQFYIFLTLLIVAALWAYLRNYLMVAGILVALAAACKIFPVLLFALFLQRKNWRALTAGLLTGAAAVAVSIAVFGWNIHRTYLLEILPAVLHGEGLPPYATSSASISSLLHYLFLIEPDWNPNPWHPSTFAYALMQATLPILLLAPAVMLIRRNDRTSTRVQMEWSAMVVAALTISTIPASYNFVLLVLPMCVLTSTLLERKSYVWLALLFTAYLGIGFPIPSPARQMGPAILLWIPRLPLIIALLLGLYAFLPGERAAKQIPRGRVQYAWLTLFIAAAVLNFSTTLKRETDVREEYVYRLPLRSKSLLQANPEFVDGILRYVSLTPTGYCLAFESADAPSSDACKEDDLSFVTLHKEDAGQVFVERAIAGHSVVVDARNPSSVVAQDAHNPTLTKDQDQIAYIHDDHGIGQLMLQALRSNPGEPAKALTPHAMNVYEASVYSIKDYAFSAAVDGHLPGIYLTDATHFNEPLLLGESRYPSLSPDGRWMAYSHFDEFVWNLWIRDQLTGATRRIGNVPCNQIQSAWQSDSKTLLYGTDCGRSLWFTAVARRHVID